MSQLVQIHAQMIRNHLSQDSFGVSKLIEFCALSEYGNLHYAHKLFDQIPEPNTFTWNTIIRGYANSIFPRQSLCLFIRMLKSSIYPNLFTFPFVIKACAHLVAFEEGRQVHGMILKAGADNDVFLINGLIHLYASCGKIEAARKLFDGSCKRDLVSWNSILCGYMNCGLMEMAKRLFEEMMERDVVSWNVMINGYAKLGDIDKARELFNMMPTRNVESWNIMISAYAKCGLLESSKKLFDEMPERNVVSWSGIITAYAQGGQPTEALALYDEMRKAKMKPNCRTIVSVLSSCAQLGAFDQGKDIHMYVDQSKIKVDSIIETALIDMYAKCGRVKNAVRIFDKLESRDVFAWTAMIGGLALNGHGKKALELFGEMEDAGVKPNAVTFVGVLCACSHCGFVEMAWHYFNTMTTVYGINPHVEHYGCMVDVLGRAGRLEEAVSFLRSSPAKDDAILWGTVLGACWIHRDVKLGETVGDLLIKLEPNDSGIYVLLSNIYARVGRWDDARKVRLLMESKSLQKNPGCSAIEVHGTVYEFYVGGKLHCRAEEIYLKLDEIAFRLRLLGYVPNTSPVLFDIEDEEKEHAVLHHSEKLAIAFGLISLDDGVPIRVVKNLRVCCDCHTVAKLISKIYNRQVIIRDRNVFHYFRDGLCSCKDFW
ncbi:hypothetical protein Scep_030837 [Stephania cephalantha]|uniref:DYW domain-containing protein n=1 Tax=Stephania cephalantha TaxID=152367 RepID=A0AAP0E0J4_9MAGN